MKRFKGFGVRGSAGKGGPTTYVKSAAAKITSPQCLPGLYSPAGRESSRRRSVDDARFKEDKELQAAAAAAPIEGELLACARYVSRRRSVDDSLFVETEDLQAVRREIWKASPQRWGSQNVLAMMSSSDSFSSTSDVQSSSRPSDASVVSLASDTIHHQLQYQQLVGDGGNRTVVLGFDANAREAGVCATAMWMFGNVLQKGDKLVLLGVMENVRGPLGYRVQVNDQTWLGPNKKSVHDEIRVRNVTWLGLPGLKKLCDDGGVKLVVDVKAAARAEVAIVQEAVALGAVHVVLDRSLHNKRRRYYLEGLSCDVTRMRRNGGVDSIRSLASIASDREKRRMPSPTSVLTPQRKPPRGRTVAPSDGTSILLEGARNSSDFNSSLSRLVKLVKEKNAVATFSSPYPTIDEADDLFSIDHATMTRRVNMLLEPQPGHMDHRRDQLAMDDDEGYESDDLFSLAGDGASRRPSVAVFCPPDLQSQSARNSIAIAAPRSSRDFMRSNLDSGPRLDRHLLPS
ncbi:hypothetical protein M758_3G026300 [Ceratodon purpureus]|nr:hypothetical protein M758_3G026300 [Ceratodon purpureus]